MADGVTVASEWAECRLAIARFDGYLQDYHKFSFGLITALFTASAFLTQSKDLQLPLASKTAIGIAVIALLVALFGLDRYYWALLSGAAERAMDIEAADSIDGRSITGSISRTSIASLSGYAIPVLYVLLIVAAAGLALTSLSAPFCSTRGSGNDAVTTCQPLITSAEVWSQLGAVNPHDPNAIGGARLLLLASVLMMLVYRWKQRKFIDDDHRNTPGGGFLCWLSLTVFIAGLALSLKDMATDASLARITMLAAQLAVAAVLAYFLFTSAICGTESDKSRNINHWPTLTDIRLWPIGANRVRLTLSGRNLGDPVPPYGVLVNGQRADVAGLEWGDAAVRFVIDDNNPATGNPWGRQDRPQFGLFNDDRNLTTASMPLQFDGELWEFLRS